MILVTRVFSGSKPIMGLANKRPIKIIGSNPNEGTGVGFFAIRGRNVTNLVPK